MDRAEDDGPVEKKPTWGRVVGIAIGVAALVFVFVMMLVLCLGSALPTSPVAPDGGY